MVDTPISGATSNTYTLVSGDLGATIYCRVTATNASGSTNAISNVVGPITSAVAPANAGGANLPNIADTTPEVTVAVSCTTGTWTGDPTITYAYQWKKDGANIGSATSSSYTPVVGDLGATLQCVVTATNGAGSASATSNTTGAVAAAPAYTGPGQIVTGAVGYWGLRGYNNSYTGPALDLHNTSTGAFVATINILSTGALDVATAATYIGTAAKVGKLYDQIGTNHLVQATNANRLTLVLNAVGSRPALQGTGTHAFITTGAVTRSQPFTFVFFCKVNGNNAGQFLLDGGGSNIELDHGAVAPGADMPWTIYSGTDFYHDPSTTANAWHGGQGVFSGASSHFNVDGVNEATPQDAGTGGLSGTVSVGADPGYTAGMNGYLTEFGLWPSAFSGANMTAMYSNQAAWWA